MQEVTWVVWICLKKPQKDPHKPSVKKELNQTPEKHDTMIGPKALTIFDY